MGKPVLLKTNELPYPLLDEAAMAANKAVKNANRYPEIDAFSTRQIIADHYGVTPDWVVAGNGSASVIQQAMIASGQTGVAFCWPSFDAFPVLGKALNMKVQLASVHKNGSCDLDELAGVVDDKTSLIIVCTPNAPTGGIVTHDALEAFIRKIPTRVTILIDEAYGEFTRDDQAARALELVKKYNNVLMTRTFSKAYGMAGLRVGYAIAHPELAKRMQMGLPYSVSSAAQAAVVEALGNQKQMKKHVEAIIHERGRLTDMLRTFGQHVVVGHGNFVWLPVGKEAPALAAALAKHDVLVKVLEPLGVRITVGTSEETDKLKAAWEKAGLASHSANA
jgi:histidinol-phosphate aminotransferase